LSGTICLEIENAFKEVSASCDGTIDLWSPLAFQDITHKYYTLDVGAAFRLVGSFNRRCGKMLDTTVNPPSR
jgi:hypothetical protein